MSFTAVSLETNHIITPIFIPITTLIPTHYPTPIQLSGNGIKIILILFTNKNDIIQDINILDINIYQNTKF